MSLQISIDDGDPRDVALTRAENHIARLWIDGREHRAALRPVGRGFEVQLDERTEPIWLVVAHDTVFIHAFGRAWQTEVIDPAERSAREGEHTDVATAPMPGTIITIAVEPGQEVTLGQPLVVIESMKMQSEIVAWRDGVVERIHLGVGDTFDRGAGLVGLAPEAATEEAA